jgi:hypothetical protein
MDYYDRKLEKGKIFQQVDEQSSLEDEAASPLAQLNACSTGEKRC